MKTKRRIVFSKNIKPNAVGVTKKQLYKYSFAGFLVILLLFLVIIPMLSGSLHFLIVLSGSMEPEISPGDIVVTEYSKPSNINRNDIITFKQPSEFDKDRYVTHRVVNITKIYNVTYFQTKGEANDNPDVKLVSETDLIGRVKFVIPYLGYIPFYASQPIGFFIFVIIPGSLLITNEFINILKELRINIRRKKS